MKGFWHWLGFHNWTAWGGDTNDPYTLSGIDKNGIAYQLRYCQNAKCHKLQMRTVI